MADSKPGGKGNGKGNSNPLFPVMSKPSVKYSSGIGPEDQKRIDKIANEIGQIFENLLELAPSKEQFKQFGLYD